ncbi:MAG TPA: phosphatidylserine/phosphatidylglycerophosphate/cardiolipin synthase family protein [Bacteriovoracaceae bacterium]|nr:phosphatidylserine/phosphatidylglycerophosphate/cardiolipin synthase family protein [Bacteriovoracaceae bacterium]
MKSFFNLLFTLGLLVSPVAHSKSPISKGIDGYGAYISAILAGSLDSAGLSFRAFMDPNLPSWKKIGKEIDFDLSLEACTNLHCDGRENYERDLSFVSGSRLARADKVSLLPNKETFEMRAKLFREARESIYIMVWSVYDDETGFEFMNQMLEALERNPEMDIRIIVDGNVATLRGHRDVLRDLEELSDGKIKIMRWKTHKYRANGTHRKSIIVDRQHVIIGGMNIGNAYANREGAPKWRDLDMLMEGHSVGVQSHNHFVEIWNSHDSRKVKETHLLMRPIEVDEEATHGLPVILMEQHPGSTNKRAQIGLHTSVVKLLRDAKDTIDIENAYIIMDPVLKKELEKALKRGVKIRVFTNSKESIDMALITNPLLKSARQIAKWGAEVYLKKGATLHSKFMVVDKKLSMVGSFNFHPRSLRFDGENAGVIIDEAFAQELTDHFEDGIENHATQLLIPSRFKIKWNFLSTLAVLFYFDFL